MRNLWKSNKGFTLVELLIVVAIIGILAAIAIPQFAAYRAKAYCSSVKSDLANYAIAQEAHFTEHDAYTTDVRGFDAGGALIGFKPSPDVVLTSPQISTMGFTVVATNPQCDVRPADTTPDPYTWDSTKGGFLKY